MGIDTALLFLSLLSFAALIAMWVAAPLHAVEGRASIAEPAATAVTA